MAEHAPPASSGFTPPESFDDFRLIRPIGRGAMGEVWLGHDRLLDRPVAVKFISGMAGDAERARFLVEARAIARLAHPNVVTIFRAGEIMRRPYLVSEFVPGQSLADLPKPVAPGQLLPIALGLARGLAAAHRRGVLHRDIKPANAILAEDGDVKLLDFGVAKLLDAAGTEPAPTMPTRSPIAVTDGDDALRTRDDPATPRTPSHSRASTDSGSRGDEAVGTPLYMAPELWRGEPGSRRSDIYSLGMLLYELAAGRAPHREASMLDLPRLRVDEDAPPLAACAPEVEARFAAIVDRCLARDPMARFASGDDLRDGLEALAEASRPARSLPEGNPYRGLARFEAHHRGLFFGRDADIRALVERLRADALVIVAGDSGVGKSSLCLAGVVPAFAEAGWTVARLCPGRHPLAALAATALPLLRSTPLDRATTDGETGAEGELAERIAADPGHLARALRRRAADGPPTLLFVDQLEELCTLAAPEEAAQVSARRSPRSRSPPSVYGSWRRREATS